MSNAAPGFAKHPNHTIEISKVHGEIKVSIESSEIARTRSALCLTEANYPVAYYLPLNTLPIEMLRASDHSTYCPFKGTANYYHLVHNGEVHENSVWTYRDPYDEAVAIKDYIAIYPNVATVNPI